ncbi:MAG: carbohydrate ABC transporter permease [Eubacteriales bacterium]|nr:carbohydrate ABC transporter permease [Eubacteriales bacterium]
MKKNHPLASVVAIALTLLCVLPFLYVFGKGLIGPGGFTLDYYYQVFLAQSQYLLRFWKSLLLSLCIAAGQLLVSILAGYGFAKCRFPGKNVLFFLLMVMMIMPLQVTLVPNYLMLSEMGLLDTYYALALPAIFVSLGTFIMTQSFKAVPNSIIDAAKLDGCNTWNVIWRIAIPVSKSGLVCTMLLSFLDGWNMVEQPIVYLKNFAKYPISVALALVPPEDPTVQLVCCILVVLPPLFLFSFFNRELVEGIALGGEK